MELLFSFKGKVGRGIFFGLSIIYLFIYLVVIAYSSDTVIGSLFFVYLFFNITLVVKRLRDVNYSLWLVLVYIIPLVGIPIYIKLVFMRGEEIGKPALQKVNIVKEFKRNDGEKPVVKLKDVQNNVFKILEEAMN